MTTRNRSKNRSALKKTAGREAQNPIAEKAQVIDQAAGQMADIIEDHLAEHPEASLSAVQPRRSRRAPAPKLAAREVELPEELLHDPQRMIYVLLLALLSKAEGEVTFTEDQLDIDDAAYNVVFARTIDGKKMIVSVVSNQSGILRTPAAGQDTVQAWTTERRVNPHQEKQTYFPPPAVDLGGPASSRREMLEAGHPGMTAQEKFLLAAEKPAAETPAQQPAVAEKLPQSFPFETGERPETARRVDLGAYAQQASRSAEIEAEQAEIAARVDSVGR